MEVKDKRGSDNVIADHLSRNITRKYCGEMSCITIWRTLCRRHNSLKNFSNRVFIGLLYSKIVLNG